jgi:hypothetical protein
MGEFTVHTDTGVVVVGPGESHFISKGTQHVVAATSDVPARALTVASPSGFAKLIRELGTSERPGDVMNPKVLEKFMQLSEELGDEILGPPGALPALRS